jgi:hypothetical protein
VNIKIKGSPPPHELKNLKGFPRKAYGLIVKKTMLGCFNLLFTKS